MSKVRARFSLELEMDFCSDGKDGEGRLGGVSEMGEEAYCARRGLNESSVACVGDRANCVRKGERAAGIADLCASARSKSFQFGVPGWFKTSSSCESATGDSVLLGGGYMGGWRRCFLGSRPKGLSGLCISGG